MTRRLAIALAISVGFNLFLGGMISSAWTVKRQFGNKPPGAAAMTRPLDLRGGIAALDDSARPQVRALRKRFGPALRERGAEMRTARREVGELLGSRNLDAADLEAALARLRRASDSAQGAMHEMMIGIVAELPPDQRRIFFEAAVRRPPGGRRERRERRDGPPPAE